MGECSTSTAARRRHVIRSPSRNRIRTPSIVLGRLPHGETLSGLGDLDVTDGASEGIGERRGQSSFEVLMASRPARKTKSGSKKGLGDIRNPLGPFCVFRTFTGPSLVPIGPDNVLRSCNQTSGQLQFLCLLWVF
jgi:hypothetical protein